ncbi:hypothetical protein SKAU_G00227400 [Synaphobranchus kaupii]|uniref:Uncharacterized protein n=1 Tax=Synaphobranchus kaupii TaxID=118154 RepID=A0A9Q1ISX7_SYNKA|nr:hypothetical protein SKAU_G00227400 [Synaphobranchus kaupii]
MAFRKPGIELFLVSLGEAARLGGSVIGERVKVFLQVRGDRTGGGGTQGAGVKQGRGGPVLSAVMKAGAWSGGL